MLTIKRDAQGFEVRATDPGSGWRGYRIKAKTLDELHQTLDHYYRGHGNVEHTDCPLCRLVAVSK